MPCIHEFHMFVIIGSRILLLSVKTVVREASCSNKVKLFERDVHAQSGKESEAYYAFLGSLPFTEAPHAHTYIGETLAEGVPPVVYTYNHHKAKAETQPRDS